MTKFCEFTSSVQSAKQKQQQQQQKTTFWKSVESTLDKKAGLGGLSWKLRHVSLRLQVRPPPGRQHFFVEIDREIFSTVILSLPLIQEGQLSVSDERIA